jgi:dynein heavy chain, axonemal
LQAGLEGKRTVFLFGDRDVVDEGFLEDVNNILNVGDVPGLFAQDDRDKIFAEMRPWAESNHFGSSREGSYAAFISRVRENLHIVLAMSPVGDAFRRRCRQFPSLINCCTIDWYPSWPEEALLSVSRQVRHRRLA